MALGLCACNQGSDPAFSGQSCTQLRAHFDDAFNKGVEASVRKSLDEEKRHITESQKTYLAMDAQGCCAKEGVCPPLNVN